MENIRLDGSESGEAITESYSISLNLSNLKLEPNDETSTLSTIENQKEADFEGHLFDNKESTEDIENELLVIKNNVLNLSRKSLLEFPQSWLDIDNLDLVQRLNLEGNNLTELPENFFKCLPLLKWLDLRNNHLTTLPSEGLQNHESLEVILLENNQLKSLPSELGTINSLMAINVRNNPLEYPLDHVIQGGIKQIKQHLLAILQADQETDSNQNNTNNNGLTTGDLIELNTGKKKVKKYFSLHAKLCQKKSQQPSMKKVFKKQSDKYLNDTYGRPISEPMLEERFKKEVMLAKLKQKMQKQDAELQAQKSEENVKKWKDKYKRMQMTRIHEKMSNGGRLDFVEPAAKAPFGVSRSNFRMISDGERIFNKMNRERKVKPSNMSFSKKVQLEKAKLSHENFLKNKVTEHIAMMKNRSYSTMEPHQIMLTAEKDLEIALKLQEEINKRRKELEFGTSAIPAELFND